MRDDDRRRSCSSAQALGRCPPHIDRSSSAPRGVLALNGGIAPEPRRRAAGALRLEEREEISRGIAAGRSMRRIAQGLRRSPSTVSREIRRNGGCSAYRAGEADRRAWERALRPKLCRLARHARLRWRVAQKLALQWSPEQISGWLKRQFAADQGMQISHETIYRSLFVQTRGAVSFITPASPCAWAAYRAARTPRGGATPPTPRWSARGNSDRRSCRWQRRRIQESLQ